MELFKIVLSIHILSGSIGLLLGSFVLLKQKGNKIHKQLGRIFAIAMIVTGLSAFVISYLHPNLFLFIVGVFTVYLTATGYRMIALKKIHLGQEPQFIDYILTISMLIASIGFLYIGIRNVVNGNNFGIVLCLFGSISFKLCLVDSRNYKGKNTDKLAWLKNHIGRMTGSYMAAFTAFLVVNNRYLPDLVAWILPTVIGTFFIFISIKKLSTQSYNK